MKRTRLVIDGIPYKLVSSNFLSPITEDICTICALNEICIINGNKKFLCALGKPDCIRTFYEVDYAFDVRTAHEILIDELNDD